LSDPINAIYPQIMTGDIDWDGYPEVLITVNNQKNNVTQLLLSVPCDSNSCPTINGVSNARTLALADPNVNG